MGRRRLPTPTQRNGSLTWEIRCRIEGKIVSRSLGTRDYDEALKRVPKVFQELERELAQKESGAIPPRVPPAIQSDEARSPGPPRLSIEQVCQLYREYKLHDERQFRSEHAQGGIGNPEELAATYKERLEGSLGRARASAIVHDFAHQKWFLTYISRKGIGDVEDYEGALMALARTLVGTYREILDSDANLTSLPPSHTATSKTAPASSPSLLKFTEEFIDERGQAMTAEYAHEHRAVVRDFCEVVGDKAVSEYTLEDARKFKEVLLALPPNWKKTKALRELSLVEAAKTAKLEGMKRQSAKSIKLKRSMLDRVFRHAKYNYAGMTNPFESREAWVVADASATDQRDSFSEEQLRALLASKLPGELYWLTWLSLCTGARLNELCQLTAAHIRLTEPKHIYFGSDLRLKTARKGGSSIRSVPLHPKLIELDFEKFVEDSKANEGGRLFPDLPLHRTGRYSDAASKAFGRHLKALGIKHKKLSFHSLRHTFKAEFQRVASQEVETRERLMGHQVPGMAGRYGSSYESEAKDLALLAARAKILALLQF